MTIHPRLAAILALMATLFVVVAMPSAAKAHPQHAHGVVAAHGSPVDTPDAAYVDEVTASPVVDTHTIVDTDCGERGCCPGGHCHGHGTAMTASSAIGFVAGNTAMIRSSDIPAPSGLATGGPARPPRTFA